LKIPSAIIGLGKIGLTYDLDDSGCLKPNQVMTHCRSISNSENFQLTHLVDSDAGVLQLAVQLYGGKAFQSLDALMEDAPPELVIISVPTDLHLTTLLNVIKVWKPALYLIEKPFGGNSYTAQKMASELQVQEATVFTNYIRRYLPNFVSLKSDSLFQNRGELNAVKISGYGTLENIFSHFLDLILFLESSFALGSSKKLRSTSNNGVLRFKDPKSGIHFEFDGVGLSIRHCEMTLTYEHITVHITSNGRCIKISDLKGNSLKDFNLDVSIFNSYQSIVLSEISKEFRHRPANTCVDDAILIHRFIESI
jgi:predicted dehydrogenase